MKSMSKLPVIKVLSVVSVLLIFVSFVLRQAFGLNDSLASTLMLLTVLVAITSLTCLGSLDISSQLVKGRTRTFIRHSFWIPVGANESCEVISTDEISSWNSAAVLRPRGLLSGRSTRSTWRRKKSSIGLSGAAPTANSEEDER